MNKYRLTISDLDREINIPISIDYDLTGQGDLITKYENEIVEKVINPIKDYETTKFYHKPIGTNPPLSDINYNFYFFDHSKNITDTVYSDTDLWIESYNPTTNPDYTGSSFTNKEIYYTSNAFKNSFFKLDFYDTTNSANQKNYLTVILPTQQGFTVPQNIGSETVPNIVEVKIPKFKLDFTGDKEGFYIYFIRNPKVVNIDTFYVTAKFFNAKTGEFIRMSNKPQSLIASKFNFKKDETFYYKVVFDYENFTYSYFNLLDQLIGNEVNPINWYEYVNP